jgi:ribonucleotide monophosphatase NagD (HAD superfamily)
MTPEEEKALDEAVMNASIVQSEDIFNNRVAHVVECLVLGDEAIRREIRQIARDIARDVASQTVDAFRHKLISNMDLYGNTKSMRQIIYDTYL